MHALLISSPYAELRNAMEEEGYVVSETDDEKNPDHLARDPRLQLIVLDLDLPYLNGLGLLQSWRSSGITTNILALSSRRNTVDKIKAFDAGADAWVSKPCNLRVFKARLRVWMRRSREAHEEIYQIEDLEINVTSRRVKRAGREIPLTVTEYNVLRYLAERRGQVVTRSMIWEHLYGWSKENKSNAVTVYIRYLRKKIDDGYKTKLIQTCWGKGYRLGSELKNPSLGDSARSSRE